MRGHIPFALLASFVLLSVGCQQAAPVTSRSRGGSLKAGHTATADVRLSPAYKQAVSSFAHHDYAASLAQLNVLVQAPERTPSEKAFLARQADLCRKAMGQTPPAVARSSAAPHATGVVSPSDCGPRALHLLCRDVFHVPASLSVLVRTAQTTKQGTSLAGMEKAAHSCGLQAEAVQMDKNALANLSQPAIAWVDGNHYVAVLNVHQNPWTGKMSATIHDPNKPEQEEIPTTALLGRSGGILLMLSLPTAKKPS